MEPKPRRPIRYPLSAPAEVTNTESGKEISVAAANINLFGCLVRTLSPFSKGTKVRVRIAHGGAKFAAFGKVAHSSHEGMGIIFTTVEPLDQVVLEKWLARLPGS